MNINNVMISGSISRDPVIHYSKDQTPVLDFSVAVKDNYKDKDGEVCKRKDFIDCVVFGKFAEIMHEKLSNRTQVCIQGKLISLKEKRGENLVFKNKVLVNNIDIM